MKRKILLIFIVLFISHTLKIEAQFEFPKNKAEFATFKSDCSKRVKAGIKYRRDFKMPISTTDKAPPGYCERYIKFNVDGTPGEIEYYDEAGRKKAIVIYQYSKTGNPQRETEFHPTGTVLSRTDYRYDYRGRMLDKSVYDQFDYIVRKVIYQVKEEDNSIREMEFSSPEMITRTIVWHYSQIDTGKLVGMDEFDGESLLKQKRTIVYEKNKIKSEVFFNAQGQKIYTLEYLYNSDGQLLKITRVFNDKTQLDTHTYKYNEKGLLAGETDFDMQGKLKKCYSYSYE